MQNIEHIWAQLKKYEGEEFFLKRGKKFSYVVVGNILNPIGIKKWNIPKSNFEKAFEFMPLEGPGDIQKLQGPSYVYALLMDKRIVG